RKPLPLEDVAAGLLQSPETMTGLPWLDLSPPGMWKELGEEEARNAQNVLLHLVVCQRLGWLTPEALQTVLQSWVGPQVVELIRHSDALKKMIGHSVVSGESLPEQITQHLAPNRVLELDAGIKKVRGEPAAIPDRMVKTHVVAWIKQQETRVRAGE